MAKQNTISIAICTYNGARYLGPQLQSLAAQTREPDELVVCDDRSSDDTIEIVKSFAANSSFAVRIHFNDERLGPARNFEKAISLCSGELIALCDQDDVWHAEKLRRSEEIFLPSPNIGIVFTDAEIVNEDLIPFGWTLWDFMHFKQPGRLQGSKAVAALLKRNPGFGQTMMFQSAFRDLILPIPEQVGHDMWIAILIAAVSSIDFIDEAMVKHRQHPKQVSLDRPIRKTTVEKLFTSSSDLRKIMIQNARLYEQALDRLTTGRRSKPDEDSLRLLQAKISHLRTRANMPAERLRRVPIALREFAALRYHRYSNGSVSLAKDLLLSAR